MTPTQRTAALRLADALDQTLPAEKGGYLCGEAAALLRELAAEPAQEPVAWMSEAGDFEHSHKPWMGEGWAPLYAAPPPATAEIERLRASDASNSKTADIYAALLADKQTEIERLRAALDLPVAAYDAGNAILIAAAKQIDGRTLWKVEHHGSVLATDGDWEYEPQPSNRDAAFLARCRFNTPHDALKCLRAALEKP